ncbi:MAG TPA: response regulator transcription factor, partial [Ktedonobacteraceae bacterium]|nr:response regulator transcription factor [Ktedonobacteraceae bacterium]
DAMKLLIVDTDRDLIEMLMSWLKTLGYEVYRAYTGKQACVEWEQREPDLVVIDPTLQDRDGLTLCREMRTKHDASVLIITDSKDVHDEIRCLEDGADDYLRKPFFPAQFLARIRAVNRRGRSTLVPHLSSQVTAGPICVDALRNEASVADKRIHLTPTESKLLHLLAINVNHVCTANQIVTHIWGYGNDGDTGLIKAHIHHLRRKIERDPGHPRYILAVPGVGYTLTLAPSHDSNLAHIIVWEGSERTSSRRD